MEDLLYSRRSPAWSGPLKNDESAFKSAEIKPHGSVAMGVDICLGSFLHPWSSVSLIISGEEQALTCSAPLSSLCRILQQKKKLTKNTITRSVLSLDFYKTRSLGIADVQWFCKSLCIRGQDKLDE